MTDKLDASPIHDSNPTPVKGGRIGSWIRLFWVVVPVGIVATSLLLPAVRSAPEARRRTQCKGHLKQIGLALHNYRETYGTFPPAYTIDENGKRLHSWRTLILPFVDQQALYDQIDLSKAWDDPANARFAKTDLSIYHCPSIPGPITNTSYMAITGTGTCFQGANSKSIYDIKDGISTTMMIIEVDPKNAVPWMSPLDVDKQYFLTLGPKSPLSHTGGLHGLFADGAVRFLSDNIDQRTRQNLITIDAGDTICGDF